MKEFVCNYVPIRFLPYRETGEFVNVGVAIFCPEIDWFDFRLETRRARVHAFFPELEKTIFKVSLESVDRELSRQRTASELQLHGSRLTPKEAEPRMIWFKDLVRRREAIVHFGDPGIMLASDPRAALSELFEDLVRRQFANGKDYQEVVMRRRLGKLLVEWNFHYDRNKRIGDAEFHVVLPFVHSINNQPQKALKPFDLDKADTSEIYNHGDTWIAKIRRLVEHRSAPRELVFAVKLPVRANCAKAANLICRDLENLHVRVVDYSKPDDLRKAAFVGKKLA